MGRAEGIPSIFGVLLTCVLLFFVLVACARSQEDLAPTPTPERITYREWPEQAPAEATSISAASGQIVPAGGVSGGRWQNSPDGLLLAHAGSPGEANILRVWDVLKGGWASQYVLPFVINGAMGFSSDGRRVVIVTEDGGLRVHSGVNNQAEVRPGPCKRISHVRGIPEGGWVVAGPGGCLARYKGGKWKRGPDSGVNMPLALSTLTRGEPVVAGISTQGRPAASVWWPDGVVKSLRTLSSFDDGPAKKEAEAKDVVLALELPDSAKTPTWANLTYTLSGALYLAMDGLPLTAFEPSSGKALDLALPRSGPWNPCVGAGVSADGSYFYALREDGMLFSGPTGLFEATWKTQLPKGDSSISLMAATQGLLLLESDGPKPLLIGQWQALPTPPTSESRPWQPQSLRFGNNGQVLAISYASPSVGGTSRWITFWKFEGQAPRRVALGTWKHAAEWSKFLAKGRPNTPVEVNGKGSLFAVLGPTGAQLYETSTTVKAGRVAIKGGLDVAFAYSNQQLFLINAERQLLLADVDSMLPTESWLDLGGPIIDIAGDGDGSHLAVLAQKEGNGTMAVYATGRKKRLGQMKLPYGEGQVALSSSGDRGFVASKKGGLLQYPRGRTVVKPRGPSDRITDVAFHPRAIPATYSGRDFGLHRWTRSGKSEKLGTLAGELRDIAFHPLGKCVAVALSSGRVEIWGKGGTALSLELWEGDRWVAWTASGSALGSQALVQALRLSDGANLYQPIVASSVEVKKAMKAACG